VLCANFLLALAFSRSLAAGSWFLGQPAAPARFSLPGKAGKSAKEQLAWLIKVPVAHWPTHPNIYIYILYYIEGGTHRAKVKTQTQTQNFSVSPV